MSVDVQKRVVFGSIAVAVLYGLFARWFFGLGNGVAEPGWAKNVFGVMSASFIFGVPFAIGFIASYFGRIMSIGRAMVVPLVPALAALGVALMLAWEGLICIFLWLPLFVVLAALGGLLAALVLRLRAKIARDSFVGAVLLMPFLLAPLEPHAHQPHETRLVHTQITIQSDVANVWKNIAEVPAIAPEEHGLAWSHVIGFPKPIAATLRGHGVGSVRHATFERDVLFIEKVTEWRENEALAFTIHADPTSIPAGALDEHVTVGGPYFDVLDGTYRIEPLPNGGVILHLESQHRLSTSFNFYAGVWTDFIMRDTQRYILEIIKRRCEARG